MNSKVIVLVLLGVAALASANIPGDLNPSTGKWATPFALPRYFQRDRGTCWDFATIGVLEESYRENGLRNGFIDNPNTYVKFSEQAYGISMMDACAKHPDVCGDLGDFVVEGSTEGGEVYWLYSMKGVYSQLLPVSVCPYYPDHNKTMEHTCPGYQAAVAKNPIKFDIKAMETAYSAFDTRALLAKYHRPLAWSSLVHTVYYYFPCEDQYWSTQDICSEAKKVRCPAGKSYNSVFCGVMETSMFNQDGEFYSHENMVPEGGHAMNVMGYNDNFVTKSGMKGGFIIRNSWEDKTYFPKEVMLAGRSARGSHSIKYWMQEISEWAEREYCPNPLNPDNWLSCVSQSAGPTMSKRMKTKSSLRSAPHKRVLKTTVGDDDDFQNTCLDPAYMDKITAKGSFAQFQPTEFQCLDETFQFQDLKTCSKNKKFRYFLVDIMRNNEGDLTTLSMLQYNTETKEKITLTVPYVPTQYIAYVFSPIDSQLELLKDDDDVCGYYWWPYELLDRQVGQFGGFFATYFDLQWEPRSYLSQRNKGGNGQYDYTLIQTSTGTQKILTYPTPNPHNNVRYDN